MTPIDQLKKNLDKAHESLNEFALTLLAANDNRIILREEILLEDSHPIRDNNNATRTYLPFYIEEIIYEDSKVKVYQSHGGQAVLFGSFNLIEKEHILTRAAFNAENPAKTEFFPITSVAREDLRIAGFEADSITDEDMSLLANKMSSAYVQYSFWEDLKIIAEHIGIEKAKQS